MMDGRIGAIRAGARSRAATSTRASWPTRAKYASRLLRPVPRRGRLGGNLGKSDKKVYQMDPANSDEALREVALDIAEGADMVMVKPGMPYLDIVRRVKDEFRRADLRLPGQRRVRDAQGRGQPTAGSTSDAVMMEALLAFKRAGADGVLTYFARWAAPRARRRSRCLPHGRLC
jgi:porphobilinogen synthase